MTKLNGKVPEGFASEVVPHGGKKFLIRELSVKESDEIADAEERQDGSRDARLGSHLTLAKAIIDPPVTIDDLAEWPQSRYVALLRAYNRLIGAEAVELGKSQGGTAVAPAPTSPTTGASAPLS